MVLIVVLSLEGNGYVWNEASIMLVESPVASEEKIRTRGLSTCRRSTGLH